MLSSIQIGTSFDSVAQKAQHIPVKEVQSPFLHHAPQAQAILATMKQVRSEILSSGTAAETNGQPFQNPFTEDFMDFYDQVIFDKQNGTTKENLILLLQEAWHAKSMLCHDISIYLSILLRNNPELDQIKDNIFVCKIDNHSFVCIGHPNKEEGSCLVVDVWAGYLASQQNDGVLLSVQDYKAFIKRNPTDYIRTDSLLKIEVIESFTRIAREITPEMIHNSENKYDTDGRTPLICAIESGDHELIRKLIQDLHTDINKVHQKSSDTPLMIAIKKDDLKAIEILLQHPNLDLKKRCPYSNKGIQLMLDAWGYACRYHKTPHQDAIIILIEAHPQYKF